MTRFVGDSLRSATTFVLNPIMGHLSFSHSLKVRPHIDVTSHYDFNVYSYVSDFSVGIQLLQKNHDQILQASLSIANVFYYLILGAWGLLLRKDDTQSIPISVQNRNGVTI
jgi:Mitochondrial distribution and morphology protein 10